jgi:hypothetical protein
MNDWCLDVWNEMKPFFAHCTNEKFKRVHDCLIALELKNPETKTNETRTVRDPRFAKYRANIVYVTCIVDMKKMETVSSVYNRYRDVTYEVDHWLSADAFHPDPNVICTNGIHYFTTLEAAFFFVNLDGAIWRQQKELQFDDQGLLTSVRERDVSEYNVQTLLSILERYHLQDVIRHLI